MVFLFYFQSETFGEENELALEDEPCYGKRCTANEHCCPGSVCVDVDGGKWKYLFSIQNIYNAKALKDIISNLFLNKKQQTEIVDFSSFFH